MKKSILILIIILLTAAFAAGVRAEEEVNTLYAETYMCGDAYTVSIVTQPQMMARIDEKLRLAVTMRNPKNGYWTPFQIMAVYGQNTDEDVMLNIRLMLRNLNAVTINGLSPESFILTGKVRDRVIEFRPEIMMPFAMDEDDWRIPLVRQQVEAYVLGRTVPDVTNFDVKDYWNPLLLDEKPFDPMRLNEIRLVYRIPSFLIGWELHVNPQPADGNTEGLRSCDLTMKLPTFKNEITGEIYKYIY